MFVGCPFRHSDPELLKQKLQFYKVSPSGISQVGAVLSTMGQTNWKFTFSPLYKRKKTKLTARLVFALYYLFIVCIFTNVPLNKIIKTAISVRD